MEILPIRCNRNNVPEIEGIFKQNRRFLKPDKNGKQIHKINPNNVLLQRPQNPKNNQLDNQTLQIIHPLLQKVILNLLCRVED